jgi:putative MFS transporter
VVAAALAAAAAGPDAHEAAGSVRELFAAPLRRTTIALWVVWFMMSFGYGGFNFFLPAVLAAKGLAPLDVFLDALLYNAAGLPGSFAASFLVETRCGRCAPAAAHD